jgi:hypothetical protein
VLGQLRLTKLLVSLLQLELKITDAMSGGGQKLAKAAGDIIGTAEL